MNRMNDSKNVEVSNQAEILEILNILEKSYNNSIDIITNIETLLQGKSSARGIESLKKDLSNINTHIRMIKNQIE
jgi:hypothetical protein